MKSLSYKRIYKSQEYLATLGTIEYRSLFGSYSLTVDDTVFAMVSDGVLGVFGRGTAREWLSDVFSGSTG